MARITGKNPRNALILALTLCSAWPSAAQNRDQELQLPALGDATSGIVSPQQERALGQSWARAFRAQVPTSHDPLIVQYLEQLLARLAGYSQLADKRLELLLVKNPTMNAFAVPGGVVGVHTGLMTTAETENQLASVLAHELGHLSQRHFARSVEAQKNASIPTTAAMLASLVLLATAGGDAGMAAMMATQAAALDNQLRFSRQNEQEADRVGMDTMVAAGLDPYAVPEMFESMLKSTRYSRRPPEFLLTHPVTESRIADAMNRATRYQRQPFPQSAEFHLMRTRVLLMQADSPQAAVKRFQAEVDGDSLDKEASRYGLVLALTQSGQYVRADLELAKLLEQSQRPEYLLAKAELESAKGNYVQAALPLQQILAGEPNNHPATMALADIYMKAGHYVQSEQLLERHSRRRRGDPFVWYQLAEVHGLAGNILGVHEARAEYFILNGIYDAAMVQLRNALKLVSEDNYHTKAILQERVRDVRAMQAQAGLE